MIVRIFYRNSSGKDERIMGWSHLLADEFRGLPLNDPSNAQIAYADIEVPAGDISYQTVNSNGVPTKKVIAGALVDRDQVDIDKDWANKPYLYKQAEVDIEPYLQGKERPTWLMYAVKNMFTYLKDLQAKAAIDDSALSAEAQTAKATIQYMQDNMATPIENIMVARDAAIAALDPEV